MLGRKDYTQDELDHAKSSVEQQPEIGEPIKLDAARFERLSKAFLAELESKFVT